MSKTHIFDGEDTDKDIPTQIKEYKPEIRVGDYIEHHFNNQMGNKKFRVISVNKNLSNGTKKYDLEEEEWTASGGRMKKNRRKTRKSRKSRKTRKSRTYRRK